MGGVEDSMENMVLCCSTEWSSAKYNRIKCPFHPIFSNLITFPLLKDVKESLFFIVPIDEHSNKIKRKSKVSGRLKV